jgi:hypothetical protein
LAWLQYLGIQDTPRKRRPPSQTPGAWASAIFKITPEKISVSVTQSKWERGREMVKELLGGFLYEPLTWLYHKDLERKRGFLRHLAMCYDSLVPFMKGFHLTIDSWRSHRPDNGWKMGDNDAYLEVEVAEGRMFEAELLRLKEMCGDIVAPKHVCGVPRFKLDLEAMTLFFSPDLPPEGTDRVSRVLYAM